ncbi:hypothetical protein CBR_g21006 [Chara braunii]|uniref:Uncharacterized protein n=1 Tax=Chara braunii TaxID=69332 RepID=A0A388L0F9_CHABU|nr:hypothetical protein CBR_g21006 [Chara braunii]|eukprot:GBG75761.1 hypothetical protein CBR_g21006 [Chara braunii]
MKIPPEYKSLRNPFLMSRKVSGEPRPPTWRTHGVVSLFIWLENRDASLGWAVVVLATLGVFLNFTVCTIGRDGVRLFGAFACLELFGKLVLWRTHVGYFKRDLPCIQLRAVAVERDGYLMVKHYFRLLLFFALLALWILLYKVEGQVEKDGPTWDTWKNVYSAAATLDWRTLVCGYQRWVQIPVSLLLLFLQLLAESALLCLGGSKRGFGLELAWCFPVGVFTGLLIGPMILDWWLLPFIPLCGVMVACLRLVWFGFSLGTRVAPESEIFKKLRVVNGHGYKCDWMSAKRWEEDGQEERLSNLTWYIHKRKHRKLLAEVAYARPELCGLPGHWFYDRKMLVEAALLKLEGALPIEGYLKDGEVVDPLLPMVLDAFPRLDDFDYGKLCPGFQDMEWFRWVVAWLVGGDKKLQALAAVIVGRVAHFMGSVMLYKHQLQELPTGELACIVRALLKMVEDRENRERQENGATALFHLVMAMANYLEAEGVSGVTREEWLEIGVNLFCEVETESGKTGVGYLLDAVRDGATEKMKERVVGTLCALYSDQGIQELFHELGGLQCMVDVAQSEDMTAMCRLSAAKILLDWAWWHEDEIRNDGLKMRAVLKALTNAFDLEETCFFEWEVILDILVTLCESEDATARDLMVEEVQEERGAVRRVVRMLESTERIISQSELLGAYQLMAENHLRAGGPLASQFAAAMDVQHVLVKAFRLLLECNESLQKVVAGDEHVVHVLTEVLLPAKVSVEQQALPISRLGRQWLNVMWRKLARGLPGKRRKAHRMAEVHFEGLSAHWATVRQLRLWAQREVIEILAMLGEHEAEAVHTIAAAPLMELLECESLEVSDSAKTWVQSVFKRLHKVGPADQYEGHREGVTKELRIHEVERRWQRVGTTNRLDDRRAVRSSVSDDDDENALEMDTDNGESSLRDHWGARRMGVSWAIEGRRIQRRRQEGIRTEDSTGPGTGDAGVDGGRDGREESTSPDGEWVDNIRLVELVDQPNNRHNTRYDNDWELTPERSSMGREGEVSECGDEWSPSPDLRVTHGVQIRTVSGGEESGDDWNQTPDRIAAGIPDKIIEGR